MKKDVANLIKINSDYSPAKAESLLLWRFGKAIKEGYPLPHNDFYLYCALQIKRNGFENLPEKFKDSIVVSGQLEVEIQFHLLRLKLLDGTEITNEERIFFSELRRAKVNLRKVIIKKEIGKTMLKGKIVNTISHTNSSDYKELLKLTSAFSDITLLDWFIPIVLKYDRLIHIFVRHVEETKFAESQTVKRTFFSYKSEEIWVLLKTIIKREAEDIKEHFIENAASLALGKPELMKPYHRNPYNPILFDGDKFAISIDKNGFIMKFHQL